MYQEYLDFMLPIVQGAGEIHLRYFRGNELAVTMKSNTYDVVTRADKESEEYIATAILARFPEHKILGEEGGYRGDCTSEYCWVVDPLDGTTNYSQGLPVFCVSVGLQFRGETIAGMIYAPYLGELYMASKGGGAFRSCRGEGMKPIRVSEKRSLAESVIATGFPYDKDVNPDNNGANVLRIIPVVRGLRRMGAAAYDLCCVANGFLDGYWELELHEWDVCAGNLIVREAGGVVEDFRSDRGVSLIAGSPQVVREMRKYIK